ncbi:MAG TPA: hypothetical protein PLX23_12395 [Candidatus Hydrogenedens sp.]|nr:hypothetical protein [Candidatus Hydrogenedens sp.]
MKEKINEYLNKRATLNPWQLETSLNRRVEQVVVVPAYNEFHNITNLLHSLSQNDSIICENTLVIIVVNNRNETLSPPEHIENNQNTLDFLRESIYKKETPFYLGVIDASTSGYELPPEHGVGLARKIGLDWGLHILAQNKDNTSGLICLDADCEVSQNYLTEWMNFFKSHTHSAGVMYSEHRFDDSLLGQCMLAYEIYLRTYELGLHYACSPYTFLPIGSTIGVSASLYVSAGGMNTRIAGEDFYFLQQLARLGEIQRLCNATVFPAARISNRVPFGTGAKLQQYINQPEKRYLTYPIESFDILRKWIKSLDNPDENPEYMLLHAEQIHPELAHFLVSNYWLQKTKKVFQQNQNKISLKYHLHEWFDGLKTIKLLHHLRDLAFRSANLFHTLEELANELKLQEFKEINFENIETDYTKHKVILGKLRKHWGRLNIAGINYHIESS